MACERTNLKSVEVKCYFSERAGTKPQKAAVEPTGIQSWNLQNKSYNIYYAIKLHFKQMVMN